MKHSLKEVKDASSAFCDIALVLMEQAIEGSNPDGLVGAYYIINVLQKYLHTGQKHKWSEEFANILENSTKIALAQEANKGMGVH
jgi:hypothetical protein